MLSNAEHGLEPASAEDTRAEEGAAVTVLAINDASDVRGAVVAAVGMGPEPLFAAAEDIAESSPPPSRAFAMQLATAYVSVP